MGPMTINDEADLAEGLRGAQDLVGCTRGNNQEKELSEIENALELYACLLWARARAANDNLPGC